jgi:Protein of unknown function (DUF4240)
MPSRPQLGVVAVVAVVAAALLGPCNSPNQDPSWSEDLRGPPAAIAPDTPTGGMDEAAFWELISETRDTAGNDTARQSQLLQQRLRQLAPEQIAGFERIRNVLDRLAYTWELWGAAYVIEDGCSEDCFRDFRAYLISLGRETYGAALVDPDSIAGVVQDAEEGDWENADDVAPEAYEDATDEDIPGGDSDLSGPPSGEEWDDEDEDALLQAYPSLATAFR